MPGCIKKIQERNESNSLSDGKTALELLIRNKRIHESTTIMNPQYAVKYRLVQNGFRYCENIEMEKITMANCK
jgi:hypothetical protein